MKKLALLLIFCFSSLVLNGCVDEGKANVSTDTNHATTKVNILKEPFSTTAGWFNRYGISVFYAPIKADGAKISGLVNTDGKLVMKEKTQILYPAGKDNLFTYEDQGKFGLMDDKGHILLKPISDSRIIYEDHVGVYEKDKKYGIIKEDMSLIPPVSDTMISFAKENIAPFSKNGKWGLINRDGKMIVEPTFDWLSYLGNDRKIMFRKGEKSGWLNDQGQIIPNMEKEISMVYRSYVSSSQGVYQKDGKYGLTADDYFAILTPAISDELFGMNIDGYAGYRRGHKYGIVHFGEIVKEPFSDIPLSFNRNNVAVYKQNGKYGLIKGDGQMLHVPDNDKIGDLTKLGFAVFYKDHQAGIIKDDGSVLIEPFCEDIQLQSGSDCMWYREGDLWGIAKLPRTA